MFDKLRKYAEELDDIKPEEGLPTSFVAKVVGVTFDGRQENLKQLTLDTKLDLRRDRRNKFDMFAIAVYAELASGWEQIGFLPQKMSKKVAGLLDRGVSMQIKPFRILGGGEISYGLDVIIWR